MHILIILCHSFAIPSLALKCDAIPGRLNSTGLIINRPSTFYGQCSEQCGAMHGSYVHVFNFSMLKFIIIISRSQLTSETIKIRSLFIYLINMCMFFCQCFSRRHSGLLNSPLNKIYIYIHIMLCPLVFMLYLFLPT